MELPLDFKWILSCCAFYAWYSTDEAARMSGETFKKENFKSRLQNVNGIYLLDYFK